MKYKKLTQKDLQKSIWSLNIYAISSIIDVSQGPKYATKFCRKILCEFAKGWVKFLIQINKTFFLGKQ